MSVSHEKMHTELKGLSFLEDLDCSQQRSAGVDRVFSTSPHPLHGYTTSSWSVGDSGYAPGDSMLRRRQVRAGDNQTQWGGVVEPAAKATLQQKGVRARGREGVKTGATLFCGLAVGSVRQWPKVSRERTQVFDVEQCNVIGVVAQCPRRMCNSNRETSGRR